MRIYQIISEYDLQVDDIIRHHIHRYKYVGKPGNQYSVIQSIFFEINQSKEFLNKHIRWYSVILNLVNSYWSFKFHIPSNDDSEPGRIQSKISFRLEKEKFRFQDTSFVVDSIEGYVVSIARLGLILAAGKKIVPEYAESKLKKIASGLKRILQDRECQFKDVTADEVFILTVKRATDNALKIENHIPDQKESLFDFVSYELYRKNILRKIERISSRRIKLFFNMDDFWNGFIP